MAEILTPHAGRLTGFCKVGAREGMAEDSAGFGEAKERRLVERVPTGKLVHVGVGELKLGSEAVVVFGLLLVLFVTYLVIPFVRSLRG